MKIFSRIIVPVLFIAAAAGAFLFMRHLHSVPEPAAPPVPEKSVPAPISPGSSQWTAYQGGGAMTGVASGIDSVGLKLRWTINIGNNAESSAAILDGTAYIGGKDSKFRAIDIDTGEIKWQKTLDASIAATPLILDNKIFIGDTSGILHVLSVSDGAELGRFETIDEIHSSINYSGGRIFFGSWDNFLYCLDPGDYHLLWKFQTDAQVHATPTTDGKHVFIGGCDHHLRSVSLASGKEDASIDFDDIVPTPPMVVKNSVIVGTMNGVVARYAVGESSLEQIWRRSFPGERFYAGFAYSETHSAILASGQDKALYCLELDTGKTVWAFSSLQGFDAPPVVCGSSVFAAGKDGRLHVIDIKSGAEIFSFLAGPPIKGAPAIGNSVIIFCDSSGNLYCLSH